MKRLILPFISVSTLIFGIFLPREAVVQGSLAYFGTYSVSETDKTIITHIVSSTFPNWNGIDRKTSFNISGDELTSTNSTTTIGSGGAQLVWKRAK